MRTAEDLARDFADRYLPTNVHRDGRRELERTLKEYARDQRHLCADVLLKTDALPLATRDAHVLVRSAPVPGEER